MNQEERDIRLLEYWQGESLSSEEVREVESWLGEKEEAGPANPSRATPRH